MIGRIKFISYSLFNVILQYNATIEKVKGKEGPEKVLFLTLEVIHIIDKTCCFYRIFIIE